MPLTAGTACVDITPPAGAILACFPDREHNRPRVAEGAHDPVQARVLALSDGDCILSICSLDLTGIRRGEVARIRQRVAQAAPELDGPGLDGPGLVLACSHTHAGPDTLYLFGGSPDDPWIEEMVDALVGAVLEALSRRVPATLSVARAPVELTHNRRALGPDGECRQLNEHQPGVTTGPVDPDLTVLRVDDARGRPLAVVFHHTAHALTLGPGNARFSADYPGVARAIIDEALPGATALFLNGAAGNVHPRECLRPDRSATEAIGGMLGRAVVELATGEGVLLDDPHLGARGRTLTFANRMDASLTVPVEVGCLALGPVVLGVVPGEYFVEFQLRFRERVAARFATLIGYANGWPGYIPTHESYAQGGYGVAAYSGDPPALSRTCLPPGAGEEILEALVELAAQVG